MRLRQCRWLESLPGARPTHTPSPYFTPLLTCDLLHGRELCGGSDTGH